MYIFYCSIWWTRFASFNCCRQHLGPRQRSSTQISTKLIKVGCVCLLRKDRKLFSLCRFHGLDSSFSEVLHFTDRICRGKVQRSHDILRSHKTRTKEQNVLNISKVHTAYPLVDSQGFMGSVVSTLVKNKTKMVETVRPEDCCFLKIPVIIHCIDSMISTKWAVSSSRNALSMGEFSLQNIDDPPHET